MKSLKQFAKFAFVGAISTIINAISFSFFSFFKFGQFTPLSFLGFNELTIAWGLGILVAMSFNFTCNKRWVFEKKDEECEKKREVSR